MNLDRVEPGDNVPHAVNVIIEVPAHSDPVKYEMDKKSGAMFVDRFMSTAMHYPCSYGYIPRTLSDDGDPVDVMVLTPAPLITGSVVPCRPVGLLKMADEAGDDAKLLAVPTDKVSSLYSKVQDYRDLHDTVLRQLAHFFEHYKDLEEGKWVRVAGWGGLDEAKEEILSGIKMYREAAEKPKF